MISIREASPADNEGLLQLTSLTPMKGRISLRVDRNPDFFGLLSKRGDYKVFIAENGKTVVGCFSVSNNETMVNGNIERVYYLADLKIHPSFEGKILTARLLNTMHNYIRSSGADLLFCTAVYGNKKVMPLFEGRAGFPEFDFAGTFRVYQIIPLIKRNHTHKYTISETTINNEIADLYNQFNSRYHFAPLLSPQSLTETRTITAFYNNTLVASLTLTDIGMLKQNVLIGLPFILKITISVLRFLNKIVPVINLPEVEKPVKVLYIKAFAYKNGSEDAFETLILQARKIAYLEKYCYLTIGIHEKDPVARFFVKYLHFTFQSLGFILSMHGNREKINNILNGILFEDYSLI